MFYFIKRRLINRFQTLLIYAIEKGNLEIIKLLLNNSNIDINQKLINFYNLMFIFIIWNLFIWNKNALIFAIEKGNLEIIRLLIKDKRIIISSEENCKIRNLGIQIWNKSFNVNKYSM